MDQTKAQLVINKVENKNVFDYLCDSGQVGLNELYLIEDDNESAVTSVEYDSTNKKLTYTDSDNTTHDIVQVSVLKTAMQLNSVATDGSYNSLGNKPRINNVELSGNKTTADLQLNYNQLTNLPTIPTLTSSYSATDTSAAMTGAATASALSGYVPTSRSVTGTGALGGGGTLTQNRTITHNLAPTGLTASASKVGVDQYGHVQLGATITASDVGAQPTTYNVVTSCAGIDASQYGTILIAGVQDETVSFTSVPPFGRMLHLYYANVTSNPITITINPNNFQVATYFFFNGRILTTSTAYTVAANTNLCMNIILMEHEVGNSTEVFCFADVLQDSVQ